jgi:glycerol-3-phosphate acyltransferase PlsY
VPSTSTIVAVLAAYALGSIPFAAIVARRMGVPDLRREGSGNPGATNVFRTSGAMAGAIVALLDVGKGAVSVLVAERMNVSESVMAAAGVAAVVGHVWPIWTKFRGGKGVATACGAFGVLAPAATMLAVTVFVVVVWITHHVSLGSIVASAALPSLAYVTGTSGAILAASFPAAALILIRHRANMQRLLAGTEPRL